MAKKLNLKESQVIISSQRSLTACRPLGFVGRSMAPIVGRRARGGSYGVGTYLDQELLLRNEYLVAENRILKSQLKGRLKLSDVERTKLGEIGHRLGRKALGEVAAPALPDTILAGYRRLIARKFDGSQARRAPGRPRIDGEESRINIWQWPVGRCFSSVRKARLRD